LGILYFDLEEWDKAIEQYQVQIQNRDKSFFAYENQAEAYEAKGMYDKAKEVLELYIDNFGEHASIRQDLALNYFFQGDYELALVETKKALTYDPDNIMSIIYEGIISQCRGDLADAEKKYLEVLNTKELGYHLYVRTVNGTLNLLKGNLKEARTQFEQGIELAEKLGDNWWKACFYTMLAYNYLKSGNSEQALKESDLAWNVTQGATDDLRWQRRALYLRGWAYVRMKSLSEAYKTADELKRLCDEGMNKKEIRLYYHLLGMVELEKKNYSKAIEYFQRAVSLLPYQNELGPFTNDHALFAEALALAYYNSGDKERAQKEYENITSMTLGKLYQGDVYVRSLYMLGKIYEEQGLKEKAKENYEKFLNLWKDADPGLPEVEEAKARFSGLNKNIS
jgi:tetratricopeptide (TPR) repeat protein